MASDDDAQFDPLYPDEDEDAILARWREWANEGQDEVEDAEEWTDTREGSWWWLATTPGRREAARQYDLMGTEVVAAAFPQWSWGEHLDDHGELRRVERLVSTPSVGEVTLEGTVGETVAAGFVVAVEASEPGALAPEFETTGPGTFDGDGEVTVAIQALETGRASNVAAGAITRLITPNPDVVNVTNAEETIGGTDVESDAAFRRRIIESYVGSAVANQLYYRRRAMNFPGIGRATVIPHADGPGTVTIIISTAEGEEVSPEVLAAFQEDIDPDPGAGAGAGQVGATITVVTATSLAIDPAGPIEFDQGYSLDGASGTIPMLDSIEATIGAYIDSVESGGEVVLEAVKARVMSLRGIHDLPGEWTLNGVAANVAVPTDPPKVAALGDTSGIVAA